MERLADHVILPAGPGDAPALGLLHVKTWRESYPGILPAAALAAMRPEVHARRFGLQLLRARPRDVILVAEGARGLVGYSAGALTPGEDKMASSEVFTLYLLRSAQGAGLGSRLLAATARALAGGGAASLVVWVLNDNRRARGFYEQLGGKEVAERPVNGWGGGLKETAYRWDDIERLAWARTR